MNNIAIINERHPRYDKDWHLHTFVSKNKEVYIKLTNELMSFIDLEEYDQIELIDNNDGTLTIRKENET
jgi:hypothetical protein